MEVSKDSMKHLIINTTRGKVLVVPDYDSVRRVDGDTTIHLKIFDSSVQYRKMPSAARSIKFVFRVLPRFGFVKGKDWNDVLPAETVRAVVAWIKKNWKLIEPPYVVDSFELAELESDIFS